VGISAKTPREAWPGILSSGAGNWTVFTLDGRQIPAEKAVAEKANPSGEAFLIRVSKGKTLQPLED
jgi:hypothetical protein